MRVLGIDPGLRTTGFSILDSKPKNLSLVAYGTIRPKINESIPKRLNYLFQETNKILDKFSPDFFSIEDMFYSQNVKTAMLLGQARGAMIIAASQADIPIFEYAPRKVKMSVCGNGAASKEQVLYMIMNILKLKEPPKPMDVSDAIAVGICCLIQTKIL
ncbi:MAG: crossover junction endodeoxyribonuclease RuvC [Candidatus Marinimicrobia bacterium]|nr:crossover junction endodeoxyribonuclease RuvC [Candidatus Neomarinimicrobiota bacterium]|tara:strand:- start:2715 stop:3191 length:477 start_codon:yes stop_codon:yes gene_type:complete